MLEIKTRDIQITSSPLPCERWATKITIKKHQYVDIFVGADNNISLIFI